MTRLLVTAGPTYEAIDDVRFVGNRSSGKLGYAVAAEGARRGWTVELVSGPTCLPDPAGVAVARVESALEMREALQSRFARCDVLVMAAAVADYRPAQRFDGKLKKREGEDRLRLELVKNPDLLAELSARRTRGQVLVGFALEAQDALENALKKLVSKGVDWLVLNGPATLGAERSDFQILRRGQEPERWPELAKEDFARRLLELVAPRS
ncbi:MAG: phosphopantothenoylcysteine decarboxylase [Planctomycetes bacterium]|nr:phosphopantothenoylcysteine decarboxylase [Planctomycetota bacterium]